MSYVAYYSLIVVSAVALLGGGVAAGPLDSFSWARADKIPIDVNLPWLPCEYHKSIILFMTTGSIWGIPPWRKHLLSHPPYSIVRPLQSQSRPVIILSPSSLISLLLLPLVLLPDGRHTVCH